MQRVTLTFRGAAIAAALTITPLLLGAQGRAEGSSAPAASAKPAIDDPTIVAIFDAANSWDIETGRIAAKKGTTKEVRDFGKMLVHDHTVVRQQGRDLAAKLKVTPTPPGKDFALYQAHLKALRELKHAKGAEFDRVFLQHEVDFHKAVLDAVKGTLLPATQNEELKNLETTVAPAFQGHMMAAQKLLDERKS
ncbi:MAG: DUF4142 domain-containing protein [Gemmatimonadaceae bacterium]|nr:DUF4142 domain-containing protein [Gemmatimonadaceae bacterium]NUQ19858.1 DUF4142 domain-containing protein [Gemmatimonadaceae bacterium]NUQ93291.1 DUF4142 domain-containing protein [Gemmatimonadaceae bacterium]NUR18929.1 DUF4142 domain-containing protein [Gemmatimonadaceae bacterium]NUS98824.1 DUF4142 domain-containing protein [Gemmatimonadaceae bacterium]